MKKPLIPRAPRVRFVHPVWLQPLETSEKSERFVSQNLSVGGMFIQSNTPPIPGAQYELLLEAKGKAFRLARAEVVWQSQERAQALEGFGVRFVDVRPRAQELLQYLVGQSQAAEKRALEKVTTPPAVQKPLPVEVIHFHPPPRPLKKPEVIYEATRTSVFELPRIRTSVELPKVDEPLRFEEDVEISQAVLEAAVSRPSQRWAFFLAFTVLGAGAALLWSQRLIATPEGPVTTLPTPAVAAPVAATPVVAPTMELEPSKPPEAQGPKEAETVIEGLNQVELAGAVSKVELVVVENTTDVELFLAPKATVSRWFILKAPPRMVIDVKGKAAGPLRKEKMAGGLLLRTGKNPNGMRLVFDLPQMPLRSKREGNRFWLAFPE